MRQRPSRSSRASSASIIPRAAATPAGTLGLQSGKKLKPKGTHVIPAGEKLMIEMPGGGGFGDPRERDPAEVLADVRDGFVSLEAARDVYKVAIRDGAIDEASTQQLRATR